MRVLYLNPFSQQVSGPDESLLALLGRLIPQGIEAHVVLPRPGPQGPRYEALGARVHYAPLSFLKRRMTLSEVALLLPRLLRSVFAVARIARLENIDLIHTNMEVVLDGAIVSLVLRLPHILHYRGNTLDRPKLVFDVLARFWTATSRRVICISDATAEVFRKRGLGNRVEVTYNPVDVDAFDGAKRLDSVRAELGACPGDLLVGTAGRIHPRKDFATFVRALALSAHEEPRIRGVIVGAAEVHQEVEYRKELETLSASLGVERILTWAGVRRDMPSVLKALDVFVLPSRHEGFGRVVAEASAACLPMVLTREGALPELANGNEDALLCQPESAQEFAAAILELLRRTPSADTRRGSHALRFSPDRIAASVIEIYRAALPKATLSGPGTS